MNETEKFANEVEENIKSLSDDKFLKSLSYMWLRDVTPHKYSYNFRWLGRPAIMFPTDGWAIQELIWKIKPDLILSGINHGSNVSTNVLYSGTMSAAVEGALAGIPSVGYSLTDYSEDADFDYSKKIVRLIAEKVIEEGLKIGTCLNVNIPNVKQDQIKGIKVCKQGKAFWDDTFDHRKDPLGKDYYWLTGSFASKEPSLDTDINYLENNYVTIVPTQYDLTCHPSVEELKKWNL